MSLRSGRGLPRPRGSNACLECKRRKLKCDLARPACARCRAGAVDCVYERQTSAPQELRFVEEDPARGSMRAAPSGRGVSQSSEGEPTLLERLRRVEERLEVLTSLVQERRGSPRGRPDEDTPAEATSVKRRRRVDSLGDLEQEMGFLSVQPSGRMRYVSKSHWSTMLDEVQEINALLRQQERYEISIAVPDPSKAKVAFGGGLLSPPPAWTASSRSSSNFQSEISGLVLPAKAICDLLVDSFVRGVHPLLPVVDVSVFRETYEASWDNQSPRNTHVNYPLLTAVLFSGAVACSPDELIRQFPGKSREQIITGLYYTASQALKLSCFPRAPTVESLAAYLIAQPMWMREENTVTTPSYMGVVVRVAQMLGLNRDPSHFPTVFSPTEGELRRRIWWQVFDQDVSLAMAAGLPPIVVMESFDVRMMKEDSELDVEAGSAVTAISLYNRAKLEVRIFERSFMEQIFSDRRMTADDVLRFREDLQVLGVKLNEWIGRVPSTPTLETYANNEAVNSWARLAISALSDRNWWYLNTPLLRRSPHEQTLREVFSSVELHCRMFIQKYVCLASLERWGRFQWSWPGNYQPTHAVLTLLTEINRSPTEEKAEASASAIDEVMALCASDGGVTACIQGHLIARPLTEGGQEAWDAVKRYRERVWEKCGLDPDVLPTREQVRERGEIRFKNFQPVSRPTSSSEMWPSADTEPDPTLGGQSSTTPNPNWEDLDAWFGGE